MNIVAINFVNGEISCKIMTFVLGRHTVFITMPVVQPRKIIHDALKQLSKLFQPNLNIPKIHQILGKHLMAFPF